MPKSKRFKKVSLTKTAAKGITLKRELVENIRASVDEYEHVFLFEVKNMRNGKLKDLRAEWKDSRFFFGRNKVMRIALGMDKQGEYKRRLSKLSNRLIGQCGLLFTNRSSKEVMDYFALYSEEDYARSGDKATRDVILHAGPLPDFSHAIEPHLRSLGMPTALEKGVITLLKDYVVCKEGQILKPPQASILKLLGQKMAEFKIIIKCVWSRGGHFSTTSKTPNTTGITNIPLKGSSNQNKISSKSKLKKTKSNELQPMDQDQAPGTESEEGSTKTKKLSKKKANKNVDGGVSEMDVS